MSKYLVMQCRCDNDYTDQPDAYILPLTEDAESLLREYRELVAHTAAGHNQLFEIEFYFSLGEWYTCGGNSDFSSVIYDYDYTLVDEVPFDELEPFGMDSRRIAVEPDGDMLVRGYNARTGEDYYTCGVSIDWILDPKNVGHYDNETEDEDEE